MSTPEQIQEKREIVTLLREQDRRNEKSTDLMLESDLDKEIEWRRNPNRFDTKESTLISIHSILQRLENHINIQKQTEMQTIEIKPTSSEGNEDEENDNDTNS